MSNFKRHDVARKVLPFIIGQFIGVAACYSVSATSQNIDLRCLFQTAIGSPAIAVPVRQELADAQAATLFCVSGDLAKTTCFTAADLARLPRTRLSVTERDGTRIAYEGVLLREILQRAGVPQGEQLRGSNLARYVVVEAADGYAVVFSLPEFDPAFGNRIVLLADRRNGQALAVDELPLRLVIPDDQRRARWVRKITRVRVMQATDTP